MDCIGCGSTAVTERPDLTAQGYHRFRCRDFGKQFNERSDGVLLVAVIARRAGPRRRAGRSAPARP